MHNIEMAVAAAGTKPGKGGKYLQKLSKAKGLDAAIKKVAFLCKDPNGGCVFWSGR